MGDNKISLKDTLDLDEYYSRHDNRSNRGFVWVVVVLMSITWGMIMMAALKACDKQPEPVAVSVDCSGCHI